VYEFREIYEVIEKSEIEKIRKLLTSENLLLEDELDHTFGLYERDTLVGTASVKGETFRCIAINRKHKGTGVINTLMTNMMQFMQFKGIYRYSIFTKPNSVKSFKYFGFGEVVRVEDAVLMEYPDNRLNKYLIKLKNSFENLLSGTIGAIVMNANPFTLGHEYLIKTAKNECDHLIIFVVEENASVFTFDERFELINSGVKDMNNVHVIPSGPYIISLNTFPGYFLNGKNKSSIHGELDISIFGSCIANILDIEIRFVGTEPYCVNTSKYNDVMKRILPIYDVKVREIERIEENNEVISASRIREAVRNDGLEDIRLLVPDVTYDFLVKHHIELKKRLKENIGRH